MPAAINRVLECDGSVSCCYFSLGYYWSTRLFKLRLGLGLGAVSVGGLAARLGFKFNLGFGLGFGLRLVSARGRYRYLAQGSCMFVLTLVKLIILEQWFAIRFVGVGT